MATITGKRFQITDGASTPTNLFPYTVSEAVYGLSNTISNAISTALSALSLSTYAGTSQIGSATQPVYYNGSALVATNLSTTYAPYNANGYLPLTAGGSYPLTGPLLMTNSEGIHFISSNSVSEGVLNASEDHNLYWDDSTAWQTIWHSGNSNLSTVDWTCQNLNVGNATASNIYLKRSSWNYICVPSGANLGFNVGATGLDTQTKMVIYNGNVGIGVFYPAYKLEVNGSIGCSTLEARVSSTAQILLEAGNRNNASEGGGIAFWKNSYHFGEINASVLALNPRSRGNVGIGTSTPSQKLHVVGNLLSTGDQVVSSDATLKENLTPVTYSVSDIAKARAVEFDWKDGRGHSMGSIAQDWLGIAPSLVHGEEGSMSLAYGQLALVNTILLARQSESHEERIARLEKENAELKEEVKRLRMN